jgi:hypothetical protein
MGTIFVKRRFKQSKDKINICRKTPFLYDVYGRPREDKHYGERDEHLDVGPKPRIEIKK